MSTVFSEKNVPYTYLIKWSETGVWYYGVRFAKKCHPRDLWITYFTSSKHVDDYVRLHGDPDIIKIRRTFKDAKSARNWEHRVLKKMAVLTRPNCLNKTDNKSIDSVLCSLHSKGKTYDEIYGVNKASMLRKMRSESNKNRIQVPRSTEFKKHMSAIMRGGGNNNSKTISIQIEDICYEFTCMNDCYKFLSTRFGITQCNARYVVMSKIDGRQIPNRKNYHLQRMVYNQFSISKI